VSEAAGWLFSVAVTVTLVVLTLVEAGRSLVGVRTRLNLRLDLLRPLGRCPARRGDRSNDRAPPQSERGQQLLSSVSFLASVSPFLCFFFFETEKVRGEGGGARPVAAARCGKGNRSSTVRECG